MNKHEKLEVLKEQMVNCQSCDLCDGRTQIVFGQGSDTPRIMIIGEAPGQSEDEQGLPFVGAAGEKLNKILGYVGVEREDVYITNSVLCRPPNNRNPRAEEMEACKWRLDLQIQILEPQIIIVLGKIAMQALRGKPFKGPLSQFFYDSDKVQAKHPDGWMKYTVGDHTADVLVSYHPSYLLRAQKRGYRIVLPHWTKVKDRIHATA